MKLNLNSNPSKRVKGDDSNSSLSSLEEFAVFFGGCMWHLTNAISWNVGIWKHNFRSVFSFLSLEVSEWVSVRIVSDTLFSSPFNQSTNELLLSLWRYQLVWSLILLSFEIWNGFLFNWCCRSCVCVYVSAVT